MRAAIFNEVGKEVIDIYDDVEVADPGPGEVRLKLHAAGVCHSDLSAMNGTLPQPAPAVLGHEGAGEIIEVGPGVDQVAVGDHVIVAWTPPCGHCAACLRGEANLCVEIFFNIAGAAKFSRGGSPIFGFAGTGTFAEEMVLPQQGVVKIPDDVPYEIGALIGCGVTTGVGAALNTAKVQPGSSVVVFGAGGVGIAAIQGARIAGAAEIVAVDMVDSKLKDAQRFGATLGVKPDELSAANAEINGPAGGFDYAIECIGLPDDHPGRLRRGPSGRHGGDRGRGQRERRTSSSTASSSSSWRRSCSARTTARPTSAPSSPVSSGSGSRVDSTSRA